MARRTITILLLFTFISSQFHNSTVAQTLLRSGYWLAGSDFPAADINSALFTYLISGFAEVDNSTFQVFIPSNYAQNFTSFPSVVNRKNPSIKTLMSIWNGQAATGQSISGDPVNSSVLSSVVAVASNRKSFIDSSIRLARLYGFQGIDLFWLWPNSTDLSRIGDLLDEWRAAISSESRNSNQSELELTMGIRYSPNLQSVSYPVDSIRKNLDWAHLVAYDYHLPLKEKFTGNHAALYDPRSNISTDFGLNQWLGMGMPANKLVLGLPYHGYAWTLVNARDNSVGAPASGPGTTLDGSMGYRFLKSFIQNYGYGARPVYNSTYVVNYFTVGTTWINYDDVETVRAKISYVRQKGLIGTNVFTVVNDDNWALSLAAAGETEHGSNQRRLLLIILLPIAFIVIVLVSVVYYRRGRLFKRKGGAETETIILGTRTLSGSEQLESEAPRIQVFTFAQIKAATNNFSNANKLGEGGYGPVYKGELSRGQQIAVKRLAASSTQGLEEFKNEVSLTARLQHVNLVRVMGFCSERDENMLIYEYMPNGSLDLYLFDPIRRYILDWNKRVRIIEGVIQGLLYLQEYSNFTIIHRDLKSSNILLDEELNAKISDFGMAKLFRKDLTEANTGRIVGTYGFAPPEYLKKGIYSMKYDVYSFGVLLLQIISSKKITNFYGPSENLNLLEYAYESWRDEGVKEFIDPSLNDSASPCKLLTCMQVALLCVQENPEDRPSMLEVFSMIRSDTTNISNPRRPAFSVKKDVKMESGSSSQPEIYSYNDPEISQLQPR
ncbi:wall-associated receptor kinase-like 5 isoform X1 [Tripterygium wilfordii]|uniref:non-specific serine/threonine protein kinase n=1 Tax=Tripterygium wilfordii TaxID=458696 RepID=A0A7J7DTA6_TRIWF|nr:cysteine-rich receptor-like protein kinase 19 [Tripterygium wilfordii]KAF5749541.1 wall-associated receptor kinase-like 5 isoform X1 [Tripterygium wilfordii]